MRIHAFHSYFKSLPPEQREQLAAACQTTPKHLQNISYGDKTASARIAVQVERFSRRKIPAEMLCPGIDWGYIRGTKRRGSK